MTVLQFLWLPVLLSAVFVFIASSIIHMALSFWHKGDYGKVPNEDKVMEALRPFAIPPGDYMLPDCTNREQMKSPEFQEKLKKGPVMMATVLPGNCMQMGRSLVQWFLYVLVVSYLTGYVCMHALPVAVTHRHLFRIASAVAFLAYAGALWPFSIWYWRSWAATIKSTIDGFVYAVIVAATFAWLWPH